MTALHFSDFFPIKLIASESLNFIPMSLFRKRIFGFGFRFRFLLVPLHLFHLGVMIADVGGYPSHELELILAVWTLLSILSQQLHQLGLVVTVGIVTVETFPPLQISLSTQAAPLQ